MREKERDVSKVHDFGKTFESLKSIIYILCFFNNF